MWNLAALAGALDTTADFGLRYQTTIWIDNTGNCGIMDIQSVSSRYTSLNRVVQSKKRHFVFAFQEQAELTEVRTE